MRKNVFILFLLLLVAMPVFSQNYEPQSPLVFERNRIQKSTISREIAAERKLFTPDQIGELKTRIKENNNKVDNRISILKNKMTNIFMDKQDLLKLVDIKKMQEQITVKKQSRKKIQDQIRQDLTNIVYQGLYLVVLNNIDPFTSKEALAKQAEKLLAPKAIKDLNGEFISGLTIINNSMLLKDRITRLVGGEMTVEKQYISKKNSNQTKFIYLTPIFAGSLIVKITL